MLSIQGFEKNLLKCISIAAGTFNVLVGNAAGTVHGAFKGQLIRPCFQAPLSVTISSLYLVCSMEGLQTCVSPSQLSSLAFRRYLPAVPTLSLVE